MQGANPPDAPARARAKSTPMAQFMLESIVRGSKIVIFSFTYCDECHEAEKIFRALKITEPDLRVVELDNPDMIADDSEHADEIVSALRTELEAQSGVNTMPQIFVGARHVGGLEALNKEWEDGQLSLALQRCAVPFVALVCRLVGVVVAVIVGAQPPCGTPPPCCLQWNQLFAINCAGCGASLSSVPDTSRSMA